MNIIPETKKDQQPILESLGETSEYVKALVELKIDQVKLDVVEKSSKVASSLLTLIVVGVTVVLTLIFAFIALGFFLGSLFNSNALGFLSVTLLMLGLTFLFYKMRDTLFTKPIVSFLSDLIYNRNDE